MPTTRLATNPDLPTWATLLACALLVVSLAVLAREMRRREKGAVPIALTGLVAAVALGAAVLRPVRISARETVIGARVVMLADDSRSMALRSDGAGTRREVRDDAVARLSKAVHSARLLVLGFSEGPPGPLPDRTHGDGDARGARSDLAQALHALARSPDERPSALVVVSDGRLDDPPEGASPATLRSLGELLRIPIHAIATTREPPADASVRRVAAAGAAVAHVPLPLRVEVGCAGGLACDSLAVTARELREGGPAALLASGTARIEGGKGTLDLNITLERAGVRIVEVAIAAPPGDTIPANDRRFVTLNVARERVRVLHVAGRPTNDVRALRQWLKSDASVDTIAFFILRTPADNPLATQDELALIPFPVDELFSEHLPSFDAIVLQDFDAQPYGLERHLPTIARYVRAGGGLIMVGGPNSFVAGGYAGTALAEVLPVTLDRSLNTTAADTAPFVPTWTEGAQTIPLLAPLRTIVGEQLPTMPGSSVLGDVRPGGVALWTHPTRTTASGAPMPVLAIADEGDGRAVALGVDGAWKLIFSTLGEQTAGRGYGALWDGLLGWLMRDPRFEPAQIDVPGGCVAQLPSTLTVRAGPHVAGADESAVTLEIVRLDEEKTPLEMRAPAPSGPAYAVDFPLPPLAAGGYSARVRRGRGPTTKRDFACEAGGDEWADSRPDPERLRALATASGGQFLWASDDVRALPLPKPTIVSDERQVVPLAPPWLWTTLAALSVGAHWVARRRAGLS